MRYLLIFFLIGCGRPPYGMMGPDRWDSRLTKYVYEYMDDAEQHGLPPGLFGHITTIVFDTQKVYMLQSPAHLGVCYMVEMNPGRFMRSEIYVVENLDEESLKRLMYHELTHCGYNVPHFGVQGDVMYPAIDTKTLPWETAKEKLFRELQVRLTPP